MTAFVVNDVTNRVRSLSDPTRKMSKSDELARSRIELTDSADEIANKVKRAVTDSETHISYDPIHRLGTSHIIVLVVSLMIGLFRCSKFA